ncbi:2-amino-4-hydroxy-6-hydroxymethyldihydropteridine diphosphokinase [Bacteroidaceae bacterium HV4-6-C5C]|jgi:2-amino-4-hydroxy-6-hydroxymethyldihydropteridine diphosphokinase|nr:2-amino-4-hydroxy-6-hydroxymethyldihydropteridine diphosphokinase [Bacteroidaceae bacterium HV4-6-C5C]
MADIYFSLGTNLGDKEQNLCQAINHIQKQIGKVISQSAFYSTPPWGFTSNNTFLNAAILVNSSFSPFEILENLKRIEYKMGRIHKSENGVYSDRVIDIDLLLYNDLILDTPTLKLPHPLLHQRKFVMEPLVEIAPEIIHPILKRTMKDIYYSELLNR